MPAEHYRVATEVPVAMWLRLIWQRTSPSWATPSLRCRSWRLAQKSLFFFDRYDFVHFWHFKDGFKKYILWHIQHKQFPFFFWFLDPNFWMVCCIPSISGGLPFRFGPPSASDEVLGAATLPPTRRRRGANSWMRREHWLWRTQNSVDLKTPSKNPWGWQNHTANLLCKINWSIFVRVGKFRFGDSGSWAHGCAHCLGCRWNLGSLLCWAESAAWGDQRATFWSERRFFNVLFAWAKESNRCMGIKLSSMV